MFLTHAFSFPPACALQPSVTQLNVFARISEDETFNGIPSFYEDNFPKDCEHDGSVTES